MALANAGLLIDFFGRPIWKDGREILVRENIGGEVCGNAGDQSGLNLGKSSSTTVPGANPKTQAL